MLAPVLVTPPAERLLSLDELRTQCRRLPGEDDAALGAAGYAAEDVLDGPAGMLSRALVAQTWREWFPSFEAVRLGLAPVVSISQVAYLDEAEVEASLDDAAFRLERHADAARIVAATGANWPTTAIRADAVRVDYVAGYGSALSVPSGIRRAALMLAAHFYDHREAVALDARAPSEFPLGVQMLVARHRRFGGFSGEI